jgi:hypothetical protein
MGRDSHCEPPSPQRGGRLGWGGSAGFTPTRALPRQGGGGMRADRCGTISTLVILVGEGAGIVFCRYMFGRSHVGLV